MQASITLKEHLLSIVAALFLLGLLELAFSRLPTRPFSLHIPNQPTRSHRSPSGCDACLFLFLALFFHCQLLDAMLGQLVAAK